MANFIQNVENGLANLISTSATSKLTEHLRTWKTVPKYYRGQLERIRKGKKGALKSIKKTSSGEYQLKIQMGKFAHPLIEVNGNVYPTASFDSKEQAMEQYESWIDDLENDVNEIVCVVRPTWESYCESNDILFNAVVAT